MTSGCDMTAVILAAGSGERMGENKMLTEFCGETALSLCIRVFDSMPIVVVTSDGLMEYAEKLCEGLAFPTKVVLGSTTRQRSALCGLKAVDKSTRYVLIHDAARCLIDSETVSRIAREVRAKGSAVACMKCRDTVRNIVTGETLDRTDLVLVQTPQAFEYSSILDAHMRFEGLDGAFDDAELYIRMGHDVNYVECPITNQKRTIQSDKAFFDAIISGRECT